MLLIFLLLIDPENTFSSDNHILTLIAAHHMRIYNMVYIISIFKIIRSINGFNIGNYPLFE